MHLFGIECNANVTHLRYHVSQLTISPGAFTTPRSSWIRGTAIPTIRACSHSLRTTPAICLRLPSETKVSRAITAERCTAGSMYWKSTCARIRVSSLCGVKCATSRSVIQVIWRNTWNYTRRRTLYTNADIVAGTLYGIGVCWIISNQSILNKYLFNLMTTEVSRIINPSWQRLLCDWFKSVTLPYRPLLNLRNIR